jgi:hypothetical protein
LAYAILEEGVPSWKLGEQIFVPMYMRLTNDWYRYELNWQSVGVVGRAWSRDWNEREKAVNDISNEAIITRYKQYARYIEPTKYT